MDQGCPTFPRIFPTRPWPNYISFRDSLYNIYTRLYCIQWQCWDLGEFLKCKKWDYNRFGCVLIAMRFEIFRWAFLWIGYYMKEFWRISLELLFSGSLCCIFQSRCKYISSIRYIFWFRPTSWRRCTYICSCKQTWSVAAVFRSYAFSVTFTYKLCAVYRCL